jgi:hypothetical protein
LVATATDENIHPASKHFGRRGDRNKFTHPRTSSQVATATDEELNSPLINRSPRRPLN